MPHWLRTFLAEQVFRMPQSHVRVVSGDVGEASVAPGTAGEVDGRPEGFVTDEHGRDNGSTSPAGEAGAIAVKL